jgi:hypothetical protein
VDLIGRKTQAVHTAVNLEPHTQWPCQFQAFQDAELLFMVDNDVQLQTPDFCQLVALKKTFEQGDRLTYTGVPQPDCLFEAGDAKAIGIAERSGHSLESVTITIGLDDSHDAARRRSRTDPIEIVS